MNSDKGPFGILGAPTPLTRDLFAYSRVKPTWKGLTKSLRTGGMIIQDLERELESMRSELDSSVPFQTPALGILWIEEQLKKVQHYWSPNPLLALMVRFSPVTQILSPSPWLGRPITSTLEIERGITILRNSLMKSPLTLDYLRSCKETNTFSLSMLQLKDEETAFLIRDFIQIYGAQIIGAEALESKSLENDPGRLLWLLLGPQPDRTLPPPHPLPLGIKGKCIELILNLWIGTLRNHEKIRFLRSIFLNTLRDAFFSLGREFQKTSIFELPEDVFFLTWAELSTLNNFQGDFKQLILDRRAALHDDQERSSQVAPMPQKNLAAFPGTPCAGDTIEGEVICIRSISEFIENRSSTVGKILIAKELDPGWYHEILLSKGVVTEESSPISHTTLLCREYGIPSIITPKETTSFFYTGDRIRIDLDRGMIIKI